MKSEERAWSASCILHLPLAAQQCIPDITCMGKRVLLLTAFSLAMLGVTHVSLSERLDEPLNLQEISESSVTLVLSSLRLQDGYPVTAQ